MKPRPHTPETKWLARDIAVANLDVQLLSNEVVRARAAFRTWATPRIAQHRELTSSEIAYRRRALDQITTREDELARAGFEVPDLWRRYRTLPGGTYPHPAAPQCVLLPCGMPVRHR